MNTSNHTSLLSFNHSVPSPHVVHQLVMPPKERGNLSYVFQNSSNTTQKTDGAYYGHWMLATKVCLYLSLSILGIVLNGMAFYTFYRKRTLLSASGKCVINQLVANFLVCLLVMPVVIINVVHGRWVFGVASCYMMGVLTIALVASCPLSLLLIAVDRYVSVSMAMRYDSLMTDRVHTLLACSVWLLGFICGILPMVGWNQIVYNRNASICMFKLHTETLGDISYNVMIFTLAFAVPLLMMSVVYIRLFIVAHISTSKLRAHSLYTQTSREPTLSRSQSGESLTAPQVIPRRGSWFHHPSISSAFALHMPAENPTEIKDNASAPSSSQRGNQRGSVLMYVMNRRNSSSARLPDFPASHRVSGTSLRRRSSIVHHLTGIFHRDNRKAAKTGLLIMLSFIICWSPFFTCCLLRSLPSTSKVVPPQYIDFSLALAYLNCVINPGIYVFRNRTVKRELGDILSEWKEYLAKKLCMPATEEPMTSQTNESQLPKTGNMTREEKNGFIKENST